VLEGTFLFHVQELFAGIPQTYSF